jgi:hypothetical protein
MWLALNFPTAIRKAADQRRYAPDASRRPHDSFNALDSLDDPIDSTFSMHFNFSSGGHTYVQSGSQ